MRGLSRCSTRRVSVGPGKPGFRAGLDAPPYRPVRYVPEGEIHAYEEGESETICGRAFRAPGLLRLYPSAYAFDDAKLRGRARNTFCDACEAVAADET